MLSHLDPSIELTGGPWYTDNELDTEFIRNIYDIILHYVREHVRDIPSFRILQLVKNLPTTELSKVKTLGRQCSAPLPHLCCPIVPHSSANRKLHQQE